MARLKLLIADGTEDFRLALAEALADTYQVRLCADGRQVLELLSSFKPDVLVLDLMLPGMDGISLLHAAAMADNPPMVLATTRFLNDYVVDSAVRLGVGYMMQKPCDVGFTAARIGDLSSRLRPPPVPVRDSRTQVTRLLQTLGVPAKLQGYGFLREAILLMMADNTQSLTKILYPEVARICGCEPAHVERGIRGAVSKAWEGRDESIWRRYFTPDATGRIPHPTNGAFICQLAEILNDWVQFPE